MACDGLDISCVDRNPASLSASYPEDEGAPLSSLPSRESSSFEMVFSSTITTTGGIPPINPIRPSEWPLPKKKDPPDRNPPKKKKDEGGRDDRKPSKPKDGPGQIIDTYARVRVDPIAILGGMVLMLLGVVAAGIGGLTPATPGIMGTIHPGMDNTLPFMGGAPDII